jgi:hypothetical protein
MALRSVHRLGAGGDEHRRPDDYEIAHEPVMLSNSFFLS